MTQKTTVFTTERSAIHQKHAIEAAPPELDIVVLRQPERERLKSALSEAVYWISERVGVIDADLIQSAPNLKLILRLGSLTHDIDLEAVRSAGVAVCYWPDSSVIHVAEHLIMQMLAVTKKLREVERIAREASPEWGRSQRTDEDTFAYNWSGRSGIGTLYNRTVGIIGFGEIGAELARRLRGWGCVVLYNKRRPLPENTERELGLSHVDKATLYAESDYLVNLLPYSQQTDRLLNAEVFSQMKHGAVLVNAGSGSVIDEHALADSIREGQLAGAALDTYEWEPLQADNPLVGLARAGYNVLLTPHTAAGSGDSNEAGRASDYTNIRRHMAGDPLLNQIV